MRVTRRVRPSQVGCGATVARRRIYAAVASADAGNSVSPPPRIALIIEPDGEIIAAGEKQIAETRRYESTPDLVAAKASGR